MDNDISVRLHVYTFDRFKLSYRANCFFLNSYVVYYVHNAFCVKNEATMFLGSFSSPTRWGRVASEACYRYQPNTLSFSSCIIPLPACRPYHRSCITAMERCVYVVQGGMELVYLFPCKRTIFVYLSHITLSCIYDLFKYILLLNKIRLARRNIPFLVVDMITVMYIIYSCMVIIAGGIRAETQISFCRYIRLLFLRSALQ